MKSFLNVKSLFCQTSNIRINIFFATIHLHLDPIGECSPPPLVDVNIPAPSPSPVTPPLPPLVDIDQATESNHDTALTIACAGGYDELVQVLLARNANIEHRDKKGSFPVIYHISVSLFAENIIMCSIEGFPHAKTSVLLSLSILTPDTYYKVFSGVANFILI